MSAMCLVQFVFRNMSDDDHVHDVQYAGIHCPSSGDCADSSNCAIVQMCNCTNSSNGAIVQIEAIVLLHR